MELIEAREGKTRFLIPVQDAESNFPAASAEVFFNKKMEINRDSTILMLKVLKDIDKREDGEDAVKTYLDAMSATGVRGLRVYNECGLEATVNDKSADTIPLLEKNRDAYAPLLKISNADANVIMHERRFDVVDIDPFGTPAPFLNAAAGCAKRYLFITATDTAPLCGSHLKAGIRRYFARPLNTEYHSEMGLRILLGAAVREIVKYDRGVEPLFSFTNEHFVRIYLKLSSGAGRADKAMENIGFIHQCPHCPQRIEERGITAHTHVCPDCGRPMTVAGPLWLGAVCRPDILERMLSVLPECGFGSEKRLARLLELCRDEIDTSTFYDYHTLGRFWKVSPAAVDTVVGALRSAGYRASRVHYEGTGIKTDAPLEEIRKVIC